MDEFLSKLNKRIPKNDLIFVVSLALFFIIMMLHATAAPLQTAGRQTLLNFEDDWRTDVGSMTSLRDLSRASRDADGVIVLKKRLPVIETDDQLNFETRFTNLDVYVGSRKIYHFRASGLSNDTSLESCFHQVRLEPEDSGGLIMLRLRPSYPDSSSRLADVRIGPPALYIQTFLRENLFQILLSTLIIFLGLFLLVNRLSIRMPEFRYNRTMLGILGLLAGTWSLIETQYLYLMAPRGAPIIISADYVCLISLAYPALRFVDSLLPVRSRLSEYLVLAANIGVIAGALFVTRTRRMEWFDTMIFIYALIFLTLAAIAWNLILSIRSGNRKRRRRGENTLIHLAGTIFIACASVDLICSFFTDTRLVDSARGTRLGMAIMMLLFLVDSNLRSVRYAKELGETETLAKVAYEDPVTGLPNRAAFERDSDKIRRGGSLNGIRPDREIHVIYFDLNDFKRVNDTFGHEKGDQILRIAGNLLEDALAPMGRIYRVGGDEFICLTGNLSLQSLDETLDRLRERETELNLRLGKRNPGLSLSLAWGSCTVAAEETGALNEAVRTADVRMYENKRIMKKDNIHL